MSAGSTWRNVTATPICKPSDSGECCEKVHPNVVIPQKARMRRVPGDPPNPGTHGSRVETKSSSAPDKVHNHLFNNTFLRFIRRAASSYPLAAHGNESLTRRCNTAHAIARRAARGLASKPESAPVERLVHGPPRRRLPQASIRRPARRPAGSSQKKGPARPPFPRRAALLLERVADAAVHEARARVVVRRVEAEPGTCSAGWSPADWCRTGSSRRA